MLADVVNQARAMSREIVASINPIKREMCWHYTPTRNALGIIEAGALLPSIPKGSGKMMRPELFFTTYPEPVIPGLYELHDRPGEWLRFGYEGKLLPVSEWSMEFITACLFRGKGKWLPVAEKIVVPYWRISLKPIALEDIAVIEASLDHGETWWNIYTAGKPGMTADKVLLTWHALSQTTVEPSLTEEQ